MVDAIRDCYLGIGPCLPGEEHWGGILFVLFTIYMVLLLYGREDDNNKRN